MHFLRQRWFDAGLALAGGTVVYLFLTHPDGVPRLLWLNRISLCLHQFEEYRQDEQTPYVFPKRSLIPAANKANDSRD